MTGHVKYPIGIQTFEKIIEGNYLYIDKTEYIYELAKNHTYVFLSRPRRFGKSLLTSTFEAYFEGRKELFQGLKAGELETEWIKYPVFRFDMSTAKYQNVEDCKNRLNSQIAQYEKIYGDDPINKDIKGRLESLYRRAYEKTGQNVVILIDEYDSPILEVMHDDEKLTEFRNLMRAFYSPIKSSDSYIRFAFITGITKFSQLSIFSEINNLKKISMLDDYDAICGISKEEVLTQLRPNIEEFARKRNESFDKAVEELTAQYDGYHFSINSKDIFNPFSLLNALSDSLLDNYWFDSGTPSWLIEQLRTLNFKIEDLGGSQAAISSFDVATENATNALPILFQSGYLTIKSYDPRTKLFTLAFPNNEVKVGLVDNLMPYYVTKNIQAKDVFIGNFGWKMNDDKVDEALSLMRSFLSEIDYIYYQDGEKSYHLIFFLIANLLCSHVETEVHNSAGRSDVVMKTKSHIYVFEFKFQGKLDKALLQIDEKGYTIPYESDGRKIVKIAVNFNNEIRTIDGWAIDRDGEINYTTF